MEKDFLSRNPRYLATEILEEIIYKEKILDNFIYTEKFSSLKIKDRELCHFLIMGTLKNILLIDYIIKKFSKVKLKKIDPFILTLLRISIFQIFFSEKLPQYAILNEAVEIVKKKFPSKSYLAKFVNGILRTISKIKNPEKIVENDKLSIEEKLSLKLNVPLFLLKKLLSQYKIREIENYFKSAKNPSRYFARINERAVESENLLKILNENGIKYELSYPNILAFNSLSGIEEFIDKGLIFFQDISISRFFLKLSKQIGRVKYILDLCAAPGGKSFALNLSLNPIKIFAVDKSFKRLIEMEKRKTKLGLKNIYSICGDCTNLNTIKQNFDLVYVDAPCTSTGTYIKNPEVFLRLKEEKINKMVNLQEKILEKVCGKVKKGGYLIYSTCSILSDENEMVVEKFLKKHDFNILNINGKKYYKTFPFTQEGIGFFSVVFKKNNN